MFDQPRIVQTEAQQAAVIHITTPREKIEEAMDPAIQELFTVLKSQGIAPVGPLFSRGLNIDPKTFDFELGIPIEQAVQPQGRVKPGELPAARVARATYQGAYEGLAQAWSELISWTESEGYSTSRHGWERYVRGPEASSDPADWRTELNRCIED